MEFLSTLHYDVKLLLVAGALALLAGLVSGTKKGEYRYMTIFAILMAAAGWRYQHEQTQDIAAADRTDTAATQQAQPTGTRARAR